VGTLWTRISLSRRREAVMICSVDMAAIWSSSTSSTAMAAAAGGGDDDIARAGGRDGRVGSKQQQ
jgi:hypothetical protein